MGVDEADPTGTDEGIRCCVRIKVGVRGFHCFVDGQTALPSLMAEEADDPIFHAGRNSGSIEELVDTPTDLRKPGVEREVYRNTNILL